jgi:hypothetical protein
MEMLTNPDMQLPYGNTEEGNLRRDEGRKIFHTEKFLTYKTRT